MHILSMITKIIRPMYSYYCFLRKKGQIKIEGKYVEKFNNSYYANDRIVLSITNVGHIPLYIKNIEINNGHGKNIEYNFYEDNDLNEKNMHKLKIDPGNIINLSLTNIENENGYYSRGFIVDSLYNILNKIDKEDYPYWGSAVRFQVAVKCTLTTGECFSYYNLFVKNYNEIRFGDGDEKFSDAIKKKMQYRKIK